MQTIDYSAKFQKDLNEANSIEATTFWYKAYERAFPNLRRIRPAESMVLQYNGVDRLLTIGKKTVTIEEKLDATPHTSSLAFEVESTRGFTDGWAEKNNLSNVFAYGYKQSNEVYFFQTKEFLQAWQDNKVEWKSKYGVRNVYQSQATVTPVPLAVLLPLVPHRRITVNHEHI